MGELEELTGVPFWSLFLANVVFGVFLAVALTWPVCALVLAVYRRSVQHGMRSTAGGAAAPPPPAPPVAGPPPRIDVTEIDIAAPPPLVDLAARRAQRAQVVFAVAGLAFGVVAALAGARASSGSWEPGRFLAFALLASWPAVPTVIALGVTRRRTRVVIWVACLAAGVLLAAAGGQALDALVLIGIPGLFMLATAARSIRGAAWLVAPALVVLWLTAVAALPPLFYLWYMRPFDRSAWILLAAVGALPALVALYGALLTLLYARKWASDETLLILQWWFVLALVLAVLFGTQGADNTVWGLAPFAALTLLLLGVALVARRTTPTGPPARLLLLRTFGDRDRSSRLLRDLTVHWRWVGSVDLITGTDLATELLEPHEFLDYLRGRLRRHFVRGPDDLDRRLDELDLRPDLDGRYRVNEMLCHDDTWRPALSALVHEVDAVLIDLRGLTPQRTGVVYEIERLVAEVPLDRVVALTDATTDQDVLRWALDQAAARAPADAPVRADPAPALRTVPLSGRWSSDLAHVLDAVGQAAARQSTREVRP